jgi:hypothetical protein
MQRSMAGQVEAERERRAKIIAAEGEYQASQRLHDAAERLESPTALQLSLFQTLTEISSENNSTIILLDSIDLFRPYLGAYGDNGSHRPLQARRRREKPSVSTKRQWYKPAVNNGLFKIYDLMELIPPPVNPVSAKEATTPSEEQLPDEEQPRPCLTSAQYFVVAAFPGRSYVAGSKNGAESRDLYIPARTWFKPF